MDKISVIIPIYNGADHLEECLGGIIHQTYSNLEIILVNDGSTDHSFTMCQQFASEDPRIILINQVNQGRNVARNHGLDVATGDFIAFIDQDDYVFPNYFESLHDQAIRNQADIAICNYNGFIDNHSHFFIPDLNDHPFVGTHTAKQLIEQFGDAFFAMGLPLIVPWAKIIRRRCCRHVYFPDDQTMSEDLRTMWKFYLNARKISYHQGPTYAYRSPNNSPKKELMEHLGGVRALEEMIAFLTIHGDNPHSLSSVYAFYLASAKKSALQAGRVNDYYQLQTKLKFLEPVFKISDQS